jgi:DNA sulfur modification protein DndC
MSLKELKATSLAKAEEAKAELRVRYEASDSRPWIIGFSGGKDSTLVCQLTFEALSRVPPKRRTRPVYILSSDTQVETPYIIDFMRSTLDLVKHASLSLGLPIETVLVKPELNDTYWVRVIGYGYPPPSKFMRWCTDRLKIKPADKFVLNTVSEHGEVMLLLGTRYDESQQRAKSLRRHEADNGLHKHSSLLNAWVWAPIRHFSTEEVWTYLVFNDSPWGGDNRALRDLYKDANSGECPLVVDETTEPCGNSRFGCYTCTVVERDKSLEGFVLAGKDEYADLVSLRNWLVELRDNHENRMDRRRNGSPGIGPLKMDVREAILERLLVLQEKLGEELISPAEVAVVKQVWLAETLGDVADAAA